MERIGQMEKRMAETSGLSQFVYGGHWTKIWSMTHDIYEDKEKIVNGNEKLKWKCWKVSSESE